MVKKKSKKLIIIVTVLFMVIVVATFIGYETLFNSIDPDEKASIDQEMDKITQEILERIKEGSNSPGATQPGANAEDGVISDPPEGNEQIGTDQGVEKTEKQKEAIAETIAAYENGFQRLQQEGNAIVDRLVAGIKADYQSVQAAGEGKLELAKLASSYSNRAKALESGIDSSVNTLTFKMKEDLLTAGMPEGEVQEYINHLKEEYKKQKDERRKLILDKAKEYL
ncbi:MAG: hypothetical protein WC977_08130 [Anaerovoracaceae bacterium]